MIKVEQTLYRYCMTITRSVVFYVNLLAQPEEPRGPWPAFYATNKRYIPAKFLKQGFLNLDGF